MTARGAADPSLEREWLAEALAVQASHGDTAFVFIAEQMSVCAKAGDTAGVSRWIAIADRLGQLRRNTLSS